MNSLRISVNTDSSVELEILEGWIIVKRRTVRCPAAYSCFSLFHHGHKSIWVRKLLQLFCRGHNVGQILYQ